MASLLLPMPLLPDESRSSDSNILMSLIVSGSTVVASVRMLNIDSVADGIVVVVVGGTGDGALLPNISTDAISRCACLSKTLNSQNKFKFKYSVFSNI